MGTADAARGLRVLVLHPRDGDGETIMRTLQRLGYAALGQWQHQGAPVTSDFDVVYFLASDDAARQTALLGDRPASALVAVLDDDDPRVDQALSECMPHAALCKPVRPLDVLTSLIVARKLFSYETRLLTKVRKLEETLRSIRTVEKAKTILMKSRRISETEAYELLRKSAMDRRVPIGQVAAAVIEANEVLQPQDSKSRLDR